MGAFLSFYKIKARSGVEKIVYDFWILCSIKTLNAHNIWNRYFSEKSKSTYALILFILFVVATNKNIVSLQLIKKFIDAASFTVAFTSRNIFCENTGRFFTS